MKKIIFILFIAISLILSVSFAAAKPSCRLACDLEYGGTVPLVTGACFSGSSCPEADDMITLGSIPLTDVDCPSELDDFCCCYGAEGTCDDKASEAGADTHYCEAVWCPDQHPTIENMWLMGSATTNYAWLDCTRPERVCCFYRYIENPSTSSCVQFAYDVGADFHECQTSSCPYYPDYKLIGSGFRDRWVDCQVGENLCCIYKQEEAYCEEFARSQTGAGNKQMGDGWYRRCIPEDEDCELCVPNPPEKFLYLTEHVARWTDCPDLHKCCVYMNYCDNGCGPYGLNPEKPSDACIDPVTKQSYPNADGGDLLEGLRITPDIRTDMLGNQAYFDYTYSYSYDGTTGACMITVGGGWEHIAKVDKSVQPNLKVPNTDGTVSVYEGQYSKNEYLDVFMNQEPLDVTEIFKISDYLPETYQHYFPGNTGHGAILIVPCGTSHFLLVKSRLGNYLDAIPVAPCDCDVPGHEPKIAGQFNSIQSPDGKAKGSEKKNYKGSNLDVLEPEFIDWTGSTEEYYPFVFTSNETWDVNVSLYVPEGLAIEGINPIVTLIANESKIIQFKVKETVENGSQGGAAVLFDLGVNGKAQQDVSIISSEAVKQTKEPSLANIQVKPVQGPAQTRQAEIPNVEDVPSSEFLLFTGVALIVIIAIAMYMFLTKQ
ncbi:hypothetical protein KY312_03395 [Candidatus Woesearchaeota archaeon]|nr:hypothetical protein [Candidatus Woesearchaeota archaeon]